MDVAKGNNFYIWYRFREELRFFGFAEETQYVENPFMSMFI